MLDLPQRLPAEAQLRMKRIPRRWRCRGTSTGCGCSGTAGKEAFPRSFRSAAIGKPKD